MDNGRYSSNHSWCKDLSKDVSVHCGMPSISARCIPPSHLITFGSPLDALEPTTVTTAMVCAGDAPLPAQEPLASLNSANKWLLYSKNQAAEVPSIMRRDDQSCDETTKLSCDLARYNSAPSSFLSSFTDLQDDGMPRMSRLSNEDSNLDGMLPAMFCAGRAQTVATSISNNPLQMKVHGLSRPILEDHKQFSAESRRNRKLFAQNYRSDEETRTLFIANVDHLAAADYACEFGTANGHFSPHQHRNLPLPEGKIHRIPAKGIKTPMRKDRNSSMAIMKSSPMATKSNVVLHSSSPASLENDDVVGFSEETGMSSLSEARELSADIGGRGLTEDSISHEGSLMSILDGASRLRKRDLDALHMNNVSSPSDLQDGSAGQTTSLTRHMSLPVPLKPKDYLPLEDNWLQDSVPCRLRAKRGCATHPRSIAERVRRTRITERMRKLQELVPNMDKQSNTAEMLDEVFEYVKFLQKEVQDLSKSKARCEGLCTSK